MKKYFVLPLFMIALAVMAQTELRSTDFTNAYSEVVLDESYLDKNGENNETPKAVTYVPTSGRRLDGGLGSGLWGGYSNTGGLQQFQMGPQQWTLNVGVIALIGRFGSTLGNLNADTGYLSQLADTLNGDDETGNYAYTIFAEAPLSLAEDSSRIEWDSCDPGTDSTSPGDVRLLLRAEGQWIVSDVVEVTVESAWKATEPVASVQPNLLNWHSVTSPTTATLNALAPGDEGPLEWGGPIADGAEKLGYVDGFGFVMAVNLPNPGGMVMPPPSLNFDALHLRGHRAKGITAARNWLLFP